MPSNLSFEAASTCPTVFITVDAAFRQAAALRPGERVLVHAAAGGVGLAAIQMASALGGSVVATAGGSTKRALVRSLGVSAAVNSRDTQFASEMAELGGADVVLNSLTSSGMVGASLATLRRGGRFVEISKRDIWSAARVAQERPDVVYTLVAVDFLPDQAVQSALARLGSQLASGVLHPLPQVAHNISSAQAALRQMSQARHVGKIVVRAPTPASSGVEPAGKVLVTGGLGTLGSLTASWLASSSKLDIVSTGRTGRFSGSNELCELVLGGFCGSITLATADASSCEDAWMLFGSRPVVGIMHASGVLSDATLRNQTLRGVRTVFAPKIAALQQLCVPNGLHPGAFQVLFSSVAALLGSPGQANYSSANTLLDSLAHQAQNSGTVATSIQWGAWAGAGMAAGDASTRARVERTGLGMVEPVGGLTVMANILKQNTASPPAILAAVPFRWSRFLERQYAGHPPAVFANFAAGALADSMQASNIASNTAVLSKGISVAVPEEDREEYMLAQINETVRAVLGDSVPVDQPLMAAGLDSLSAVEFRNGLEAKVGVELPGTLVFDYPTTSSMAAFLAKKVQPAAPVAVPAGSHWASPLDVLTDFSGQIASGPGAQVAVLSAMSIRSPADALTSIAPVDASGLIPCSRWDVDSHAELFGGVPVRFGPTLRGIDLFDAHALAVPEAEAMLMDPQQRLLLELTAEVLPADGGIAAVKAT